MREEASPNGLPAGAKKRNLGCATQMAEWSGRSLRENTRRVLPMASRGTLDSHYSRWAHCDSRTVRVIRSLQFGLLGKYRSPPKYSRQEAGLKVSCQCALYEAVLPYRQLAGLAADRV